MLQELRGHELLVAKQLLRRLVVGRQSYGQLDLHDNRDFFEEAVQEALDLIIYKTMEDVRSKI
jgi:hypothetical protein